ncbi:amino-acid N-acetyltransferase [Hydromonas duriensis]|uniref:Amino-acid acetyltransferase n=1 Tax=Hydromonas duriensis TaxID=1527608 RepID=A0A4R6Y3N9_9BURK|nr:N-acetylglutamate synthase [Hydromonas duriensis]
MSSTHPASLINNPTPFVQWLRGVAPYVHAFRDKTFVIAFGGELIEQGRLEDLVFDVSLLKAMGMRIVLVHGAHPQIESQLSLRGINSEFANGMRITSAQTLEAVKEACGALRLSIEAVFSQGLPNTPMAGSSINVVSGNFITAKPVGVLNGIDFLHTGVVRKINREAINSQLAQGQIVLLSPLGFSPTGEVFNLSTPEVAAAVASQLHADKLILLSHDNLVGEDNATIPELDVEQARAMSEQMPLGYFLRQCLSASWIAVQSGVPRAHIVPVDTDGALLLELFQHDGVGTMITKNLLETLREAAFDDLGGILQLITPLEENGTLVARGREKLETELPFFSVIEHDNVILGCAALYPFPEDKMAEMACFSIDPDMQGMGLGERMLAHMEKRARKQGFKELFVLTTRAAHWFLKHGFAAGHVDDLPADKKRMYNWQRKSQIFIKKIM